MMSSMMVNAQLVSSLEAFRYIKSPKTLSGSPWLHFPCETNISFIRRMLEVNMSAYGSALRWSLRGESLGTCGIGGCGILVVMGIFEEVVRMRRGGERGALATIVHTNGSIPSYESSRMLVRDDGSIVGTVGGGCVEADVWAAAKEVILSEQPRKMTFNLNNEAEFDSGLICGGTLEIFVEPVLPTPMLYIFGGGHVSVAVASVASQAGFKIGVIDDREAFANAERFPMASELY